MDIEQRIYRTVTSLSYDLVDSTILMQQIGAEEYAVLIETIHRQFAEIVATYGGISDAPQGDDGLMCYFGAQIASEHARDSALSAGLAMQSLAIENDWRVRIGIAYGQVAIYKQQPVGSTVHLAARIQKIAKNQQILVSSELVAQTNKRFVFEQTADAATMKGFDRSPIVFELKGKLASSPTKVNNPQPKVKAHLYGRQAVLKDLRRMWQHVQTHASGSSLHFVGEAGIGKSTLVQNFAETLKLPSYCVFIWTCFQEHQQTAYQPLKAFLMHAMQLSELESAEVWHAKIAQKTASLALDAEQQFIIYFLLDQPIPSSLAGVIPPEDPQAYEIRVLHTLMTWLRFESKDFSWLLIAEDLHWADPATHRFFMLLQQKMQHLPGLLLTTQRPAKADSPVAEHLKNNAQVIHLGRLNYEESSALVEGLCTGLVLEAQEMDWIVERAGGIPLFIHECVHLIQSAYLSANDKPFKQIRSAWLQRAESAKLIGNETQEILMQRIDALGEQRIVAQIASAIGSEFRLEVLLRVCRNYKLDSNSLQLIDTIHHLVEAGIFCVEGFAQQQYSFSHALIRDVAYQSMWGSDRKKLHVIILEVYAQSFPELLRTQPSQMAQHWMAAGNYQNAASCLLDAAQQARIKGAHLVSIDCCQAALDLLQGLPEGEAGQKMQLQASLLAAGQIMATKGYGSESAGLHFRRAMQLGHQLGNSKALDKAQLGLSAYYLTRSEFFDAEHHIRTGINSPHVAIDPLSKIQWELSLAMLHFYRGQLVRSSELMAQCAAKSSITPKSNQLIQNPAVVGQIYQAFCLWTMGQTEAACDIAQQSLQLAEQQPLRLCKILTNGIWAMLLYCRGEWQRAFAAAQTALDTSPAGEYELWLNLSQFILGASRARLSMQGDLAPAQIQQGLSQMHSADESWARSGAVASRTFYLCILAQCHLDLKQFAPSQSYLDQAQALIDKHSERYFSTEVRRTQAAWHMTTQASSNWADLAKAELNQSYEEASARGLYSLALRVAITMLDWEQLTNKRCKWSSAGKTSHVLLAECLDHIDPFASTLEAVHARSLLTSIPTSISTV